MGRQSLQPSTNVLPMPRTSARQAREAPDEKGWKGRSPGMGMTLLFYGREHLKGIQEAGGLWEGQCHHLQSNLSYNREEKTFLKSSLAQ